MTIPPGAPAGAGVEVTTGLAGFARDWARAVVRVSYVPMTRTEIEEYLQGLAERLVTALLAEPFVANVGYQVGVDLVAADLAAPEALGRTVTIVQTRLLEFVVEAPVDPHVRLSALVEALITGYCRALRDRTLDEQETIRRAAMLARERAERALWESEAQRRHAALHDPLTGLPNRALFTQRLTEAVTDPAPAARLAICLLGLDGFNQVNDSLGHQVGDELLLAVADRLGGLTTSSGCLLTRFGGDEFAFLIEGTTGDRDAVEIAEQALSLLTAPVLVGQHELSVSASIGVVEREIDGSDAAELIRAADITLRWAKTDGRNRWRLFDQERNAHDVARYRLSAAMPTALDRDEFTLVYQPLVDLHDDRLSGVEALARWQHPELGLLSPGRFIELAEDTGLIVRLGQYLLEKACRQAASWLELSPQAPFVSVNLAVRQLLHPGLVGEVAEVLDRTGLPAGQLQLEITETGVIGSGDGTIDTLHALARLGIRLAIDDFGTGYANLAYLRRLPVHRLKLASSFLYRVREADSTDPTDEAILATLIDLGHTLNLTVIAEGVETAHQARRLAELGCDTGQGWYLGRPASPQRISGLILRSTTVAV